LAPKAEKKRIPSNLGSQFATLEANVSRVVMVFRMLFHQSINLVTITEERLFTTKKITKRKMFKRKCS
jgi:hypothetical protein